MIYEHIKLKELYPVLDRNGADPVLKVLVQDVVREEYKGNVLRPSLLICPGGGYAHTFDGEAENIGFQFMSCGFNAFVLKYSVAPYTFPQSLLEVACAVDYIVKNAEKFNSDKDKAAILGFSAGGHLAASYCTIRNCKEVTDIIPDPLPVQAAILCYPVITAKGKTHLGSFKNLLGKAELTEEDKEKFSLENHVSAAVTPKTFIWATAADNAVNVHNSLDYALALSKEGIEFEMHILPKGEHGLCDGSYGIVRPVQNEIGRDISVWVPLAKRWIQKIFEI